MAAVLYSSVADVDMKHIDPLVDACDLLDSFVRHSKLRLWELIPVARLAAHCRLSVWSAAPVL